MFKDYPLIMLFLQNGKWRVGGTLEIIVHCMKLLRKGQYVDLQHQHTSFNKPMFFHKHECLLIVDHNMDHKKRVSGHKPCTTEPDINVSHIYKC